MIAPNLKNYIAEDIIKITYEQGVTRPPQNFGGVLIIQRLCKRGLIFS